MACCLCMTIPFSSWTAFSVGLISEFGLGFGDYLKAIPFMFYPLCMMLLSAAGGGRTAQDRRAEAGV